MTPSPRQDRRSVAALLLLVAVVQLATMPTFAIRGDPIAIRGAAAGLLHFGTLGIPADAKPYLKSLAATPGKYFFEHESHDRLYSKYGILNTLLFIPPLAADYFATGQADPYRRTGTLILFLNLYNVVFALAIAWLLYRIAGLYSEKRRTRWFFVLTTLYATFLWYYLRAQSSEILQVMFMLGLYDQAVRYLRSGRPRSLLTASLAAAALTFLKAYYALLFVTLLPFILRRGRTRAPVFAWCLPAAATVLLLFAVNTYKFGSPLEFGYGQYAQDTFSPFPRLEALSGFLFQPDRSIFLHAPLLIPAFFGLPLFWRRHRRETLFVATTFGAFYLFLSCFHNWAGHWCYGPRYLLFLLPLMGLPALPVFDRILYVGRSWPRLAGCLAVALGTAVSFRAQTRVNALPFHVYYDLKHYFSTARVEAAEEYFHHVHFSRVCRDLLAYRDAYRPFPPITALEPAVSPALLKEVEDNVRALLYSNYFWLQPTRGLSMDPAPGHTTALEGRGLPSRAPSTCADESPHPRREAGGVA